MKNYVSLGELLIDYRKMNRLSQTDLAVQSNVDIRTVIRWEKDETLVKPDKEEELAVATFIPYQVVRNLNSNKPIPTYFDFRIRKYAMTELSAGLPGVRAFAETVDAASKGVRPVMDDPETNMGLIMKYHRYLYKTEKPVNRELIRLACKMLPDINLIQFDNTGHYAGHSIVFPLRYSIYEKLHAGKMTEGELKVEDLVNFRTEEVPVFYAYSIYADSNDNFHYIFNAVLRFLRSYKNYIFSGLVVRPDAISIMLELGLKKVWEDESYYSEFGKDFKPVFMEGQIRTFPKF
jgi:transcriptional regulator with XRE-family HTH domain